MLDREITLFRFMRQYARLLIDGIDESRFCEQPAVGINHPAWIVGHLTVTCDFGLSLLGLPRLTPDDWRSLFGASSKPEADATKYPAKAVLLIAWDRGADALEAAASAATAEQLAVPNPLENRRAALPTLGDLLSHILSTHVAIHLGQLSAWRRVIGLPPAA